jgi:hypothetical protein
MASAEVGDLDCIDRVSDEPASRPDDFEITNDGEKPKNEKRPSIHARPLF